MTNVSHVSVFHILAVNDRVFPAHCFDQTLACVDMCAENVLCLRVNPRSRHLVYTVPAEQWHWSSAKERDDSVWFAVMSIALLTRDTVMNRQARDFPRRPEETSFERIPVSRLPLLCHKGTLIMQRTVYVTTEYERRKLKLVSVGKRKFMLSTNVKVCTRATVVFKNEILEFIRWDEIWWDMPLLD